MPSSLDTSAGEIVLDLSDVQDLAALDGQEVELDADFGRIEVIVPEGLSVDVDANVDGPGHLELFGDERGGIGIDDEVRHDAGSAPPRLPSTRTCPSARSRSTRGGQPMSTTDERRPSGRHQISIGHLVMGIAFLGIVGVWALDPDRHRHR